MNESKHAIDSNPWFLLLGILILLFVVAIPLVRRQYKARKVKHGFQLYMKKKLGVVLNILTSDKFEYKQPTRGQPTEDLQLTFDKFILQFEQDLQKNKGRIHAHFAFGVLVNLQQLLMIVSSVQNLLSTIDLNKVDERTQTSRNKLSKKEHHKLTNIYRLIELYLSITTHHDKFGALQAVKRQGDNKQWTGLIPENFVHQNQDAIFKDIQYLRENESSINEILNVNRLLTQELKPYDSLTS